MTWLVVLDVIAAILLLAGAPYVPTHESELEQLFAELGSGEGRTFADLGSGDGRVLMQAQMRGFKVVGFEVNPFFWLVSKFRLGWDAQIQLKLWQQANLSDVDVIYIFSTSWHMRSQHVADLPESATIVVYGPQPKSLHRRISSVSGSAVIYQPVART